MRKTAAGSVSTRTTLAVLRAQRRQTGDDRGRGGVTEVEKRGGIISQEEPLPVAGRSRAVVDPNKVPVTGLLPQIRSGLARGTLTVSARGGSRDDDEQQSERESKAQERI